MGPDLAFESALLLTSIVQIERFVPPSWVLEVARQACLNIQYGSAGTADFFMLWGTMPVLLTKKCKALSVQVLPGYVPLTLRSIVHCPVIHTPGDLGLLLKLT